MAALAHARSWLRSTMQNRLPSRSSSTMSPNDAGCATAPGRANCWPCHRDSRRASEAAGAARSGALPGPANPTVGKVTLRAP